MSGYTHYGLARALRLALKIAIVGALALYALAQAWPLIEGPTLTLAGEDAPSTDERAMTITGVARNVTAITLNGRPIFTDEQGLFNETVVLENGYTILTLRAEDRYGRVALLERPLVYTPAYGSNGKQASH